MAQRTTVVLVDDLDGESEATETIKFGWLGVEYSIDLNAENAIEFADVITPYVVAAQRTGGRRKASGGSSGVQRLKPDTKAVRAWAASQGIEVSSRGRIPAEVVEKYEAAH